jgi:hypothetical protein
MHVPPCYQSQLIHQHACVPLENVPLKPPSHDRTPHHALNHAPHRTPSCTTSCATSVSIVAPHRCISTPLHCVIVRHIVAPRRSHHNSLRHVGPRCSAFRCNHPRSSAESSFTSYLRRSHHCTTSCTVVAPHRTSHHAPHRCVTSCISYRIVASHRASASCATSCASHHAPHRAAASRAPHRCATSCVTHRCTTSLRHITAPHRALRFVMHHIVASHRSLYIMHHIVTTSCTTSCVNINHIAPLYCITHRASHCAPHRPSHRAPHRASHQPVLHHALHVRLASLIACVSSTAPSSVRKCPVRAYVRPIP